ncbi:uncharacterized protein LOC131860160 [Cryptomeria japonica]|uniref:uncharacterized protein LOC131860160 n=1 Tax=Cryptomeria japonica TaxID=3369 RepID=UPI0027DA82F7|nr:uncharacterized protein LOC131860160 [Cryptomeria japonica]
MVNKDECLMEAVQPQTMWIIPMGYEVDAGTLDTYAQHLLNALADSKEEKFETCKEKSMELHTKFIELARKRKVAKIRKKQKPQRKYVAVSLVASETKLDTDIPKAPKKGEFARIIQKPQYDVEKKGLKEKKAKFDLVPTSKPKRGKKIKSYLDEAIEFDEATQLENPSVNDVNKEEDTHNVVEKQILDSVEVELVKENDKSVEIEVGAPSDDNGAHEALKGDKSGQVEAKKKEEEKLEESDKGKGKMSLAERMIIVVSLQVQASQELAQYELEEKRLIENIVSVLEQVVPELQLDANASSSDKL